MAAIDVTKKPLPTPTAVSQPYWDGLAEHEIRLQRCAACERLQFYPRPSCRECGGAELSWETVDGTGHVYTCTVIYRPPFEAFAADVPYVYAVVELDAGPRLVSTIVTEEVEAVRIGDRVRARFDDMEGVTLLRFELDPDGE